MNCLAYALRFWEKEPSYKLYYSANHVINSKTNISGPNWLPAENYGYDYFVSAFDGLLDSHEQFLLKKYFNINPELKWLTLQELEIEKQREADFWERFCSAPWQQYPKSNSRKLGTGLYALLKQSKSIMHTLTLRYFSVFLKLSNIPSSPMMSVIFDAAAEHCREKGYGDSFSMDQIFGFRIDNKDVFRIAKTLVDGKDILGTNPGENEVRQLVRNGHIVEVFFLEDIKSILS